MELRLTFLEGLAQAIDDTLAGWARRYLLRWTLRRAGGALATRGLERRWQFQLHRALAESRTQGDIWRLRGKVGLQPHIPVWLVDDGAPAPDRRGRVNVRRRAAGERAPRVDEEAA